MRCGMPAVSLSRVGAGVVESGPGGQDLAAGTWQRLGALPDPRSPRGRIDPLALLSAISAFAVPAARHAGHRAPPLPRWRERPPPRGGPVGQAAWPGRPAPPADSVGPDRRPVP